MAPWEDSGLNPSGRMPGPMDLSVKVYGKNLTDKFHTSGISVGTIVTQFLPPDYRRVVGVHVVGKF